MLGIDAEGGHLPDDAKACSATVRACARERAAAEAPRDEQLLKLEGGGLKLGSDPARGELISLSSPGVPSAGVSLSAGHGSCGLLGRQRRKQRFARRGPDATRFAAGKISALEHVIGLIFASADRAGDGIDTPKDAKRIASGLEAGELFDMLPFLVLDKNGSHLLALYRSGDAPQFRNVITGGKELRRKREQSK